VLQCCVVELEGVNGRRSSNTPLTLGSTVKRLSKCILRNTSLSKEAKEQVGVVVQVSEDLVYLLVCTLS
jgi:hypothetical protein